MTKTLHPLSRRGWLATWLQDRRRARQKLPAPVLRTQYPSLLAWDWNLANPFKWNVWQSLDGGASYILIEDYWAYGAARQFSPDGGSELHFIVGVDASGKEITHRSNAVRPDDATAPNAPVILDVQYNGDGTEPGWADLTVSWSFAHGGFPTAQIEVWMSVDGNPFALLFTASSGVTSHFQPAATEIAEVVFKARYRNGETLGPYSAPYPVNVEW